TYERFMDGQFAVLLGYALLPFFARSLLNFYFGEAEHTLTGVLKLAGWLVAMAAVSIHSIGYALILGLAATTMFLWRNRQHWSKIRNTFKFAAMGALFALLLSSYWIVPAVTGHAPRRASLIRGFDE